MTSPAPSQLRSRTSGHRSLEASPVSPAQLAMVFARLFCEVESGRRSPAQLERMMDVALIARLRGRWLRPGPPGRVLRVTGCFTSPTRYEAVAVVSRDRRVGAIGLRLDLRPQGWTVEEAVRPEDGPDRDPDRDPGRVPGRVPGPAPGPEPHPNVGHRPSPDSVRQDEIAGIDGSWKLPSVQCAP